MDNIRQITPDGGRDNASAARDRIFGLIHGGGLAADGRLPTERDLCARLGISRRAVRRALDALEAEGLVWRRQGKGTFAGAPPDPGGDLAALIAPDTDPLSVMEARLALEPELAALAARRASAAHVAQLRALADRAAQADDGDAAELWDGALHRRIADIAGNPILRAGFTLINAVRAEQRWQHERQLARSPALMAEYARQHICIIDAIHAHDEAEARAVMRAHLTALKTNLERVRGLATQDGPQPTPIDPQMERTQP